MNNTDDAIKEIGRVLVMKVFIESIEQSVRALQAIGVSYEDGIEILLKAMEQVMDITRAAIKASAEIKEAVKNGGEKNG